MGEELLGCLVQQRMGDEQRGRATWWAWDEYPDADVGLDDWS